MKLRAAWAGVVFGATLIVGLIVAVTVFFGWLAYKGIVENGWSVGAPILIVSTVIVGLVWMYWSVGVLDADAKDQTPRQ